MTSVSSPFILACLICIIASSASSTHSNLRGLNILDLVDLDLDNLPCYMRNDPRSNDQCAKQRSTCEEGKHCFAISVGGGTRYVCSSNEPCSKTTDTSNTTTTTSTTTTTPVCIRGGYDGCHPSPLIQPNCCPGSYCTGDGSSVVHRHYTSYKCVDISELGGGELVE